MCTQTVPFAPKPCFHARATYRTPTETSCTSASACYSCRCRHAKGWGKSTGSSDFSSIRVQGGSLRCSEWRCPSSRLSLPFTFLLSGFWNWPQLISVPTTPVANLVDDTECFQLPAVILCFSRRELPEIRVTVLPPSGGVIKWLRTGRSRRKLFEECVRVKCLTLVFWTVALPACRRWRRQRTTLQWAARRKAEPTHNTVQLWLHCQV